MTDSLDESTTPPGPKTRPDSEPFFTLYGADYSAPYSILTWIRENFETAPDYKLQEAFQIALRMKHYPYRKTAD